MSNPHRLEPDIMTTGEIMNMTAPSQDTIINVFDREMSKLELAYLKLKEEGERRNSVITFLWDKLFNRDDD